MNTKNAARNPRRRMRVFILPVVAGVLFSSASWAAAQSGHSPSSQTPTSEGPLHTGTEEAPEKHTWKIDQLIPLTVAQAWQMSGKNEDRFFDMVQDLAAFSAQNRHLILPQSQEAGQQAGEYIKQQAKADHQELLYVIVDRAVRKVGKPASSGQAAPAQ